MPIFKRPLTQIEVEQLKHLSRSQTAQARHVRRAQLVLGAHQHRNMCDAVRALGTDKHTIRTWCDRFTEIGIDGLCDRPRPGNPGSYTPEQIAKVIATALTPPRELGQPFGAWTLVRLAAYLRGIGIGISPTRVGEVLRGEGLKWRKQETWVGPVEGVDPAFQEKRGPLSGHTPISQKVR